MKRIQRIKNFLRQALTKISFCVRVYKTKEFGDIIKIIKILPNEDINYIAHIRDTKIQTVEEHLQGVAGLTGIYASKFGLTSCGQLAGLLHDIGKLTDGFQQYILQEKSAQKGPDHSTAGAVYMNRFLSPKSSQVQRMTAQIIALAIMSHHGGLVDVFDPDGKTSYLTRLEKLQTDETRQTQYQQVLQRLPDSLSISHLQGLFDQAVAEVNVLCNRMKSSGGFHSQTAGLLCKALFSALIDGDRTDTMSFMDNHNPPQESDAQELWQVLQQRLEAKISAFPTTPDINILRQKISNHCYENGRQPSGIYTLNCPTGSGKTFASLRFALEHCGCHGKQRIFFIVPYLTILEQNVKAIKEILGDDPWLDQYFLELHSAKETEKEQSETELKDSELVCQRMDAPLVFTSMVRFLNTLFASGTKNMRGLHQFANSILIFDEIQTLSLKHIGIFNEAINFLTTVCGATVVLSTATQPYLDGEFKNDKGKNIISPLGMAKNPELSGCDAGLREAFRRTKLVDCTAMAGDVESLSGFVWDLAKTHQDVLVILNTKAAVKQLYTEMERQRTPENQVPIYLLTTNLYPAHRKEIIAEIRSKLGTTPLITISTQLIEAGVDISFQTVVRSLAGLDSIIQAAGRCNRHGTFDIGNVHLVKPDFEKLQYLPKIQSGREVMQEILRTVKGHLDEESTISTYFQQLYGKANAKLTYPIPHTFLEIYSLLGENKFLYSEASKNLGQALPPLILKQSFKTAARYFRAIEEFGTSVVVAHGEAIPLLAQIPTSYEEKSNLIRKLQQYTVNLSQFDQKEIGKGLHFQEELGIYILDDSYYSQTFGVSRQQLTLPFCNY